MPKLLNIRIDKKVCKTHVVDIHKFEMNKAKEKFIEIAEQSTFIMIIGYSRNSKDYKIRSYSTMNDNDSIYVLEKIKHKIVE